MADKQPPRTKKYFRPTKAGAGMTKAGVARYRRENPGARSAGQMKKFPKAAKDPNSRLRQARKRWRC
jgi:hypothetical protein